MAHAPPVPSDQQTDHGAGADSAPDIASETGAAPRAADPNQKEQGEAGNRNQNFTPHLRTQDR